MPRNILCFIMCAILCVTLAGCSGDKEPSDNESAPYISAALGENPKILLSVGDVETIAFRIETDEPVFQSDFTISVSNSEVAKVTYYGISGKYVYYRVTADAVGSSSIYLEMPAYNIRSEAISVTVSHKTPDNIHASLGEEPVVSIPEGSSRTVCFYIGESISEEDVTINISDENFASVSFVKKSGPYFYYLVSGLTKGSAEIYAEINTLGLKSETITVNIVEKGTLPGYEEMTEGYICNTNSKTFHKPTCSYALKINDENKVIFDSDDDRQEIIDQGYSPCKSCNP